MKKVKLSLASFKDIVRKVTHYRNKLKECEAKLKFYENQINKYNEMFAKGRKDG